MFGGRLGADLSLMPRPLSERGLGHKTRVDLANWWLSQLPVGWQQWIAACACVIRGPFFPVLYIYIPHLGFCPYNKWGLTVILSLPEGSTREN